MLKIFLIASVALSSAACLSGKRAWGAADVVMETGFVVATGLDAESTYWRYRMHDCNEVNPIVGPCASRVPLAVYVPVALAAHLLIAHYLPGKWRTIFQAATLGFEASVVEGNYMLEAARGH